MMNGLFFECYTKLAKTDELISPIFFLQIYYSEVHVILALFSLFNYEPPEAEKFFEACINHTSLHLGKFVIKMIVRSHFSGSDNSQLVKKRSNCKLFCFCLFLRKKESKYIYLGSFILFIENILISESY